MFNIRVGTCKFIIKAIYWICFISTPCAMYLLVFCLSIKYRLINYTRILEICSKLKVQYSNIPQITLNAIIITNIYNTNYWESTRVFRFTKVIRP